MWELFLTCYYIIFSPYFFVLEISLKFIRQKLYITLNIWYKTNNKNNIKILTLYLGYFSVSTVKNFIRLSQKWHLEKYSNFKGKISNWKFISKNKLSIHWIIYICIINNLSKFIEMRKFNRRLFYKIYAMQMDKKNINVTMATLHF